MKSNRKPVVVALSVAASLILCLGVYSLAEEYYEHKASHRKGEGKHGARGHGGGRGGNAPVNALYVESCGGCHWAYSPVLLPEKSWENILATLNDHFGSKVVLDAQQRDDIVKYLAYNAADRSSAKVGSKIANSLAGAAPGRIVDVPYIVKKHRKVDPEVFSRKNIRSLSNCIACHPGASSAQFDDDDVRVPQE